MAIEQVRNPPIVQPFHLFRKRDDNGHTGTGVVAVGAIFPSGKCAVQFLSYPFRTQLYKDLDRVKHIHGHHGKTVIVMGLSTDG